MANQMKNMRKMKRAARKARRASKAMKPNMDRASAAARTAMGVSAPKMSQAQSAMSQIQRTGPQGAMPPSRGKGGARPAGPAQLASSIQRADMGGMQRMKGGGYLKKKIDGKASKGKTKGRVC